jgi:nitrogen fixation protein NifU and related proteins
MTDLSDLYQEVILDHNKRPRNFHKLDKATRHADGHNPLCGDKVTVYVELEGDRLRDISFEGSGCAISKASASMMTEALKGKTRAEADGLFEVFHRLVTGKGEGSPELGKLLVFSGVREFPVRVKCASLAWHTLRAALQDVHETTSTE